jgi:TonB family protein
MPKLAINIKRVNMNHIKIGLAVALSLLINFAVFYNFNHNNKKNWLLNQSELQTGANTSGIIENINLISSLNNQQNNKQTSPNKKLQGKQQKKIANTKSQASTSSGSANPQIKQLAKLKYSPPPLVYPSEAVQKNAVGKVTLKAFINSEGIISNITVVIGSGYKILDEAAIEWFKKLKFEAATNGEQAIGSFVSQTISFSLNEATN